MSLVRNALIGTGVISGWELFWWWRRRHLRTATFLTAQKVAACLNRPLVVVGAPDRGPTGGYSCGDITIDIGPSECPITYQMDISKPLPFQKDSVVVFVSCVLEYVDDYDSAMTELQRIAGKWLYVVRVEPWTLTAYLYPGRKRTITSVDAPSVAEACMTGRRSAMIT